MSAVEIDPTVGDHSIDITTLPGGWAIAKLGDLVSPSKEKIEPNQWPDAPYLSLGHVEGGTNRIIGRGTASEVKSTKAVYHSGDVLYGKLRPYLNKVYMPDFDGICSTDFLVFPSYPMLDSRFLMYFLSRTQTVEFANHFSSGIELPRISFPKLSELDFPVAPLSEQSRIVSKVDQLFSRTIATRERLSKVQEILKKLRQSILATACSGRMTEDWRRGREFTDGLPDESELPAGWERKKLSEVCEGFQYGSSRKSDKDGQMPVLRMGNIQEGEIDWADLVYTSNDQEISNYLLQPNTVLFNRTNSPELVGKTGIYRGQQPAIFAGYLIRILHGPDLDPTYLNMSLNTLEFREYCSRVRTDGVSQSNINAKKLAAYEMPWCPLEEQEEIVRRVESLFKSADDIQERVRTAASQCETLPQAILAKAFRGDLVSQDINDEPATQLLERIRSARAMEPDKPKRRNSARKVKMIRITTESVKDIIRQLPEDQFTFDELRSLVSADYELLKDIVFKLLEETEPNLTQAFDSEAREMRFVRVKQ